jgi:hypothetical protein
MERLVKAGRFDLGVELLAMRRRKDVVRGSYALRQLACAESLVGRIGMFSSLITGER